MPTTKSWTDLKAGKPMIQTHRMESNSFQSLVINWKSYCRIFKKIHSVAQCAVNELKDPQIQIHNDILITVNSAWVHIEFKERMFASSMLISVSPKWLSQVWGRVSADPDKRGGFVVLKSFRQFGHKDR